MKALHLVAFTLVIIGALNWGLVAAFNFNLVDAIFGSMGGVARVIYILVGLSAIMEAATHAKNCRHCGKPQMGMGQPGM
jgi:uncharacterized membrane protein YuzA (DUF378 family)